jgi:hypothetical protein
MARIGNRPIRAQIALGSAELAILALLAKQSL